MKTLGLPATSCRKLHKKFLLCVGLLLANLSVGDLVGMFCGKFPVDFPVAYELGSFSQPPVPARRSFPTRDSKVDFDTDSASLVFSKDPLGTNWS